eukprot:3306955-Pyramimonas_sp.AAC.1
MRRPYANWGRIEFFSGKPAEKGPDGTVFMALVAAGHLRRVGRHDRPLHPALRRGGHLGRRPQ